MTTPRHAVPEDAAELVRLRRLMFAAMTGRDAPGAWERHAEEVARRQLADPQGPLVAFVVDGAAENGAPRLAACAVGTVEQRLPAPGHPSGLFAFVFNVCTDVGHRGLGYARATTEALLGRFTELGVSRVDLHATEGAEPLYRSLGFAEHSTALSLDLRSRPSDAG
ncbi:GNAT family N-acetyltransferase [Streptomyces pinistramenti]|uniref:GNAT family N-acetyltransferase n=1 Tax=Streptomyces pinistramenti TaxID=2884812 RepID=UPI001D06E3F5|nr:GNAT family N-acetyltransferase [Streptomyces pinistramenti]MCB5909227.1 GNAT family N-acetyltransferase [Streptomyces pinistramenti]